MRTPDWDPLFFIYPVHNVVQQVVNKFVAARPYNSTIVYNLNWSIRVKGLLLDSSALNNSACSVWSVNNEKLVLQFDMVVWNCFFLSSINISSDGGGLNVSTFFKN